MKVAPLLWYIHKDFIKVYVLLYYITLLLYNNAWSPSYLKENLAFRYKAFKARKMLCAIDHNYHLYRPPLSNESGESCYYRTFNQRTECWDIASTKGDKDYSYIPMLMAKIFKLCANDDGSMQDYMEMSLNDPRKIAPTIARVAPLPTNELVAAHRSCFQLIQGQNASSSWVYFSLWSIRIKLTLGHMQNKEEFWSCISKQWLLLK